MWSQFLTALQNISLVLSSILQVLTAMPSKAPIYAFAALPAPAGLAGQVVYVSNGRKPGEGAGLGTGMLAFSDGSGWFGTDGTALLV